MPREIAQPEVWPALTLYATTVFLEAEGEPYMGKLAVAYVIRNRAKGVRTAAALDDVILRPWQFSCWNADYADNRKQRLASPDAEMWDASWQATAAAWWSFAPDPTYGANHYLNPKTVKAYGELPRWYDEARITAKIGAHEFLRLA